MDKSVVLQALTLPLRIQNTYAILAGYNKHAQAQL